LDGSYLLRGLRAGSYTLFGPTISGYRPFGAKIRILSMPGNGAGIGQWLPYQFDFTGVRGRAWQDDNFNGIYDSGDTLLTNDTVSLTGIPTGTNHTTTTDSNGLFRIDLSAGDGNHHFLSSDPPALYEPAGQTLNYANLHGYTTNLAFKPGAVGGCVTNPTSNAAISGLAVTLRDADSQTIATTITGSNGCYLFSSGEAQDAASVELTPGTGDLIVGSATQPAVYLGVPLRVDWEVAAPGEVWVGLSGVDNVSISGGQSLVSGYQINLETSSGTLTQTTNFEGMVHFGSVSPGQITATVALTGDNIGVYPASWQYDLPPGGSILGAGFRLGTHGVTAECRTPPVPGQEPNGRSFPCTVDLYRLDQSEPVFSLMLAAGEQFFYQPSASGLYIYRLVLTPDLPNGDNLVATDVFFLSVGDSHHFHYPNYLPEQISPISGMVWNDINANGTQEIPDEGAAIGFTVELVGSDGTLIESTTSDETGHYYLYPPGAGTYGVRLVPPTPPILPTTPAYVPVTRDLSDLTGDVVHFGTTWAADGIQGRVRFNDLWGSNASNITVQLLDPDNKTTPLDTTTSGPDGRFTFGPLLPDDYLVRVLPPNGGTAVNRLLTATTDGTPYLEIILPPEGNKPTIFVYTDENGNGLPDSGEGLPDVSVAFDLGICGNVIDINTTDSDGFAPSDLVFPNGGCARATGGFPDGLSPAIPDGVDLAPYDNGIVPLELVAEGTVVLRPFWDINGNDNLDINEPLMLNDVTVSAPPELELVWTGTELFVRGPAGSYALNVTPPETGLVWQPVIVVVPALSQGTLDIPIIFTSQLGGMIIGPNSGAVSGRTIELRNADNQIIATTTAGVTAADQPGGRSYTPPSATTGGPAMASFAFVGVAPGEYVVQIGDPPAGTTTWPVHIGYDPATGGSVQLHLNSINNVGGVVYWDHDYDGRWDVGESGTNFYDVMLLNDAGLPPQQVTPAWDGTYVFTGLQVGVKYALTVPDLYDAAGGAAGNWLTEAPGWFEMGALTVAHIGVGNFGDDNPNSLAVGQVYVQNGTIRNGMAGAVVGYYQLQSAAGFCNASNPSILGQTTSDSEGQYRLPLTYIPGGSVKYCLVILDAPGLVQNDLTVIADAAVFYTLPGGQVIYDQALNLDMDIKMRVMNSRTRDAAADADPNISWSAFRDENVNGLWDTGEFPLPGVTVTSGAISASSDIAGIGTMALTNGKHFLTITPPTGYAPVGPTTRTVWLAGSDVELPPIGFAPAGLVSGIVFADKDGDGWLGSTAGEFGLGELSVSLAGPVNRTTTTLPNGQFQFSDLPNGDYTVTAAMSDGFVAKAASLTVIDGFGVVSIPAQSTEHLTGALYQDWDGDGLRLADEGLVASVPITITVDGVGSTLPMGGSILFWDVAPGSYTIQPWWSAAASTSVTLASNDGGGFTLSAVPPGVVRGTLWLDENRNGLRQPWESPLSGIVVTLDDGDTVTTDENGRYTFANVSPGSHSLSVDLPAGLIASIPAITLEEDRGAAVGIPVVESQDQNDFGIYLPLVIRH
jgi:hypothetical protein